MVADHTDHDPGQSGNGTKNEGFNQKLHADLALILEPLQVAEEGELYPLIARIVGGLDPTSALFRAHGEIRHDILRVGRVLDAIDIEQLDPQDVLELQRLLYDLHAVLRLHLAQERDSYQLLAGPSTTDPADKSAH